MKRQHLLCVILMLTVAPIVACSTLVCLEPSRWGGSINPITIIVMAMFGIITTPLWPTYIPALIITALLMNVVARSRFFRVLPVPVLIGISLVIGGIGGVLILARIIVMNWNHPELATEWAIAGAVAGSITFALIVLLYRRGAVADCAKTTGMSP